MLPPLARVFNIADSIVQCKTSSFEHTGVNHTCISDNAAKQIDYLNSHKDRYGAHLR